MKKTLDRRVFNSIIIQIAAITIMILISMNSLHNVDISEQTLYIYSLIGTIIFLKLLILWRYSTGTIFSPFTLFLLSFFMFQFGQCFLRLFNLDIYLKVFEEYSNYVLLKGMIITIISTQFFQLGASFSILVEKQILYVIDKPKNVAATSSMKKIGWFLLIITSPLIIYTTFQKAIFSFEYGYMNLYDYHGESNFNLGDSAITILLSTFFLISFIMLIIAYKEDRKKANKLIVLFSLFAIIDLISGARVTFISIVLTILCMKNLIVEKINFKNMSKIVVMLVLLSIIIPFVAVFRLEENKSLSSVLQGLEYITNVNPIVTTINELGVSMSPLLTIIQIMPSGLDYKWGESYAASIFTLFPNVLDIMGTVHPGAEKAHLAQWLMKYNNMDHGPGFSMIAESYYNFGYGGVIVLFIWGYIFGKLLEFKNIRVIQENPIRSFVVFSSLLLFFALPRAESLAFMRNFVYFILGSIILIKLLSKKIIFKK